MKRWLRILFIENWPRKLSALVAALIIWLLVSHSLMGSRTISNIPIRVLNIPQDKTIQGLLPNGQLDRRLTLTLTGRKAVLDQLTGADLEVVVDASGKGDRWTTPLSRRNLVSLTPGIDLARGITDLSPVDLTIQLSRLLTERVPVTIAEPLGEPPSGYLFVDIWPRRLMQTVTGPQPLIEQLQEKGLTLTLDLDEITPEMLQALSKERSGGELRYFVPASQRRVWISGIAKEPVALNDPEAALLHIDFIKKEILPLNIPLPIGVFFPLASSKGLNPSSYQIASGGIVKEENGIPILALKLYAKDVSPLFVSIVREFLQITFVATPSTETQPWSIQFVNPHQLEERYIRANFEHTHPMGEGRLSSRRLQEEALRRRFQRYLQTFSLLTANHQPLRLEGHLEEGKLLIEQQKSEE